MTERAFRFGAVAGCATSDEEWLALARRAEALDFTSLLVPDRLQPLPLVAGRGRRLLSLAARPRATQPPRLLTFLRRSGVLVTL
ncbi:MAG TPA: hypothetical protein VHS99_25545 [Chloroflexota bacterium]|nr:hypothetical protein [Chloroflexota bacterium]